MHRLYLQIYVTFVAIFLLLAVLLSLAWLWLSPGDDSGLKALATLVEELLPEPGASRQEVERALQKLSSRFDVSLALSDAEGRILGTAGAPVPAPQASWTESRFLRTRGRGITVALRLSGERWLVARHHQRAHALAAVTTILLAALAVALGAFPLVRRLTRRLERLQARVDALGKGELQSRVEVEGRDEVAKLASSFNLAAERIERLLEAQRTLLAGASHELRTPLTRIRMAAELLGPGVPPPLREGIERDVEQLDELIGELILASRIEARQALSRDDAMDVLALAAEEGARYDAAVTGTPVDIRGDRSLVRRLLRNLLENAVRHAPGAPIEVHVGPATTPRGARVRVMDRGSGVPAEERERVFEPFYQSRNAPGPPDRGVGLGLALVRRIARLHGGEVKCLPRAGGGSVFEVELFDIR